MAIAVLLVVEVAVWGQAWLIAVTAVILVWQVFQVVRAAMRLRQAEREADQAR